MEFLINYIVESGISLTLLTTVYVLFLRKETFFRQNRIFLLTSILFSVLLPLIKLPAISSATPVMLSEVTVLPYRNLLSTITIYGKSVSSRFEHAVTSMNIFGYIYILGVLLFFIRLAVRVIQVGYLIQQNRVQDKSGYKLVVVGRVFSPFSFLNYIFVSSSMKDDEDSERMIFHELEHIKQGHTVDILILEILAVFQWFNPFMWLLKRLVRENHEYLADKAVLSKGVSCGWYKQLLLNQYVGQQYIITNSFNYSLIKKRMKMMSKIRSSKLAGLKYIFGLASIVALLITFGCEQSYKLERDSIPIKKISKEELQKDIEKIVEKIEDKKPVFYIVEEMPEFPGGKKALHKFIAESVEYPVVAQDNGIQGRVYVSFVVSDNGEVTDVKLAKGVDSSLDKEAIRVISSMPKWKPGKQRGINVKVSFTVPINFALGDGTKQENKTTMKIKPIRTSKDGVFFYTEDMPQFPGGEDALHKYINESIKYPEIALNNGIIGRVYVMFVIDESGAVTDVKLARGVDPALDKEAIRVISNMPKWKPGTNDGKNVKISYTVPVNFNIKSLRHITVKTTKTVPAK